MQPCNETWWRQSDSNRRHPACKAGALPTELCPQFSLGRFIVASFHRPFAEGQRRNEQATQPCNESWTASDREGIWRIKRRARLHLPRTPKGPARDGSRHPGSPGTAPRGASVLLRKEVIQPQVPLRLPCYDFIPITTHTLGGSVPCGFGHRLRVQTAFMM